jgi:4-amino-4-deoxy-L-arabinose transferase-like glycosyltransferase
MTMKTHLPRVLLLMACASGLLGWKAGRTAILFADGLRYIDQAKRLDQEPSINNLFRSVDHPAFPLAIAGMHRVIGGVGPESWQLAAQVASIVAGVLLVVPLYLIAAEMFGAGSAWLAVALAFLVPLTGQVMADTLSESLFFLFWSWGVWAGLRFLREGTFALAAGDGGARGARVLGPARRLAAAGGDGRDTWPSSRCSARPGCTGPGGGRRWPSW